MAYDIFLFLESSIGLQIPWKVLPLFHYTSPIDDIFLREKVSKCDKYNGMKDFFYFLFFLE